MSLSCAQMPMLTNATALLILSGAIACAPWNWSQWQTDTKIDYSPWHDVNLNFVIGWGVAKAVMVKEYAWAFWSKSETEQLVFTKAQAKQPRNKKAPAKKTTGKCKGKESLKSLSYMYYTLLKLKLGYLGNSFTYVQYKTCYTCPRPIFWCEFNCDVNLVIGLKFGNLGN